MFSALLLAWLVQAGTGTGRLDVSTVMLAGPTVVVEIDAGKLKGEPRRLAWGPGADVLYLQMVEGNPPEEVTHHYVVTVAERAVKAVEAEPPWAAQYWAMKQDRVAPGIPSLAIEVEQKEEIVKAGTGPAGVLDREGGGPDKVAGAGMSPDNLARGVHGDQKANVVRLRLLGREIATWTNERVIPGTRFSWGPSGSGALVYVGEGGRLVLFDEGKHTQTVRDVKDALLPAWSADGGRLAYLQRTARKKYAIACLVVAR